MTGERGREGSFSYTEYYITGATSDLSDLGKALKLGYMSLPNVVKHCLHGLVLSEDLKR